MQRLRRLLSGRALPAGGVVEQAHDWLLRGREMAHQDLAMQVMQRLKADLADISKVELEPKMEGRQAIMMLVPAKVAAAPAAPAKTE